MNEVLIPTRYVGDQLPTAFRPWRAETIRSGLLPIVVVAGSRGKSTVVRLLGQIAACAGLDVAMRTNVGVEINRTRQWGEVEPWHRVLDDLSSGRIDLAIEECDWTTIHALGLAERSYPVVVVTNVCANREVCLIREESRRALAALPTVFNAAGTSGTLVMNGEDREITIEDQFHDSRTIIVGHSLDAPLTQVHLESGGIAAWCQEGQLHVGGLGSRTSLGQASDLPFGLNAGATFQVQNALFAAAAAAVCGIPEWAIERGLTTYSASTSEMPDSVHEYGWEGVAWIVDRPNPSWFLRSVLKAIRDRQVANVTVVTGKLDGVPLDDLVETGRLLGRIANVVVSHSIDEDLDRAAALRHGIALNERNCLLVHTLTERRAIARAQEMSRAGDLVFVLTSDIMEVEQMLSSGLPTRDDLPLSSLHSATG